MNKNKLPHFLVSLSITLLFVAGIVNSVRANMRMYDYEIAGGPEVNLALLNEVNWNNINEHIRYLSSLGSRVTGYSGCKRAAEYIGEKFTEYGLNVSTHEFNVTVPVDLGTSINFQDYPQLKLTIHPFIPNLVVTNAVENLTAPIVYIGNGDFHDMNNKSIEASIALMDFNSHGQLPARFGAKAVIYIAPDETTKEEIDKMRLKLPIYFPRFYISKEDALKLMPILSKDGPPVMATICSKQVWEVRIGKNIIARLEGKTYPNATMIISSFYDSYSVVPSVAPGANDAAGVASLLEIARVFRNLPKPDYTILFIAFSGHYQGLAGSRNFVEDVVWNQRPAPRNALNERFPKGTLGLWVETVINLGLTTRSDEWALTDVGDLYGHPVPPQTPIVSGDPNLYGYMTKMVAKVSSEIGKIYATQNAHTATAGTAIGTAAVAASNIPAKITFPKGLLPWDHEPFGYDSLATTITLATVDSMQYAFNPIDTFDKVNLDNLRHQLETIMPIVHDLAMTPTNYRDYLRSIGLYTPPPLEGWPAYRRGGTFLGTVAAYDKALAWYSPVPYALVIVAREIIGTGEKWQNLDPIVVMADEKGMFRVPMLHGSYTTVMAFKLNSDTGRIEFAPDMGVYEYAFTRPVSQWMSANPLLFCNIGFLTVFKCGTLVLYDFVDPETGSSADVSRTVTVLDALGDAPPDSRGVMIEERGDSAVIFAPADTSVKMTLNVLHLGRVPLGVLLNNSEMNPVGIGYTLKAGEQYTFENMPLEVARNFLHLSSAAVSELQSYGIRISGPTFQDLRSHVRKVEEDLDNKKYDQAYYESLRAWSAALEIYINSRNTKVDVINGIPFFSLILILFVPLFQQLVLPMYGGKRILSLVSIFAAFLVALYMVHPGFWLASNAFMVVISLMIIILVVPSISILGFSLTWVIRAMTKKMRGLHIAEVGRASVIGLCFSLGIENVKKRKVRSTLVIITILLVVSSLVMFTSVSQISKPAYEHMPFEPPYTGVLIRQREWIYPLDYEYVESLKGVLEAKGLEAMPRAVLYTMDPALTNPDITFAVKNARIEDKTTRAYAVVGLTPELKDSHKLVDVSIIKGRWFIQSDRWTCILSDKMAAKIGITTVPEKIIFLGKNFTVIGIADSVTFDKIWDLNVQGVTPWNMRLPEQDYIHVASSETLILDYESLLYFSPQVASVSIMFKNPQEASNFASETFSSFKRLEIWSGIGNLTYLISSRRMVELHGMQMQMLPLVIASLMIFNIMLGSIYERRKDIQTFSTVGSSPTHVSAMFISEAGIYSLVSGMFGYLLAVSIMRTLLAGTDIAMNFASTWVITAMGISMLIVLSSILYPLRTASRLVTPSLERMWKIPTKPLEDTWGIPFPFVFKGEEVNGVCVYLIEFLEAHVGEEAAEFSVRNLAYTEGEQVDQTVRRIVFVSHLTPYELGVVQDVNVVFVLPRGSEQWEMNIGLLRKAGPRDVWEKNNYSFLDKMRKQFLLWRALKPDEKETYVGQFSSYRLKMQKEK